MPKRVPSGKYSLHQYLILLVGDPPSTLQCIHNILYSPWTTGILGFESLSENLLRGCFQSVTSQQTAEQAGLIFIANFIHFHILTIRMWRQQLPMSFQMSNNLASLSSLNSQPHFIQKQVGIMGAYDKKN